MSHSTPLITTVVAGLCLAWALGVVAQRLKLPPLFGYLLAGIAIGPFTPGYVADPDLAGQLAELGVILLMFGVGLHFSWQDLLAVRGIAVPGALLQIACATLLGVALGISFGWDVGAALIFGLALSVASTVVLLRALQERRLVQTDRGRVAVGWLIVEDIVMVLALVILPTLARLLSPEQVAQSDMTEIATALAITITKIAAFAALMLLVGKRAIPWILHYVAHTGSRELFRLTVLAMALGTAFAAASLFDVSFALGAFFAGMVLSESTLSQQAAQETLPLRDAFAVLFFVSVGMLFDPSVLAEAPLAVLATLAIIVLGKSAAAFGIVRMAGYSAPTAFTISASLAQIGEFSFILANLGVALALLPVEGRDLILAGAILSILVNPFLFALVDRIFATREAGPTAATGDVSATEPVTSETLPVTELTGHVVLVGYGGVGACIGPILQQESAPLFVIDDSEDTVSDLREQGVEAVSGNAADPKVIAAANMASAKCLLVAVADAFEGGQIVQQARELNPSLVIVARAHSEAEAEHLKSLGATSVILAEDETGRAMVRAYKARCEIQTRSED